MDVQLRRRRRWPWLLLAAALATVGFCAYRGDFRVNPNLMPLNHQEDGTSSDLEADKRMMWETGTMDWVSDPARRSNKASTDRAIHAASRVFNTISLEGMTRSDVVAALGDPKTSNDSIYNFPFWDTPRGSMVYRFDTGAYGWQFNVVFGLTGRVSKVERHWIH